MKEDNVIIATVCQARIPEGATGQLTPTKFTKPLRKRQNIFSCWVNNQLQSLCPHLESISWLRHRNVQYIHRSVCRPVATGEIREKCPQKFCCAQKELF